MDQLSDDYLTSSDELEITEETTGYLIETTKWAKFIAITFYILCGLAIIFMLVYGKYIYDTLGPYGSRLLEDRFIKAIIIMAILAIVVAVTWYFLIVFANKMRAGLEGENIEQVNAGLGALKVHFIIIGILILLFGILYPLYTLFTVYS